MSKNFFDPNETFLDSSNLPEFNMAQFEGRIESPLSKISVILLGGIFLLVVGIYIWKVANLQILHGKELSERAENNRLEYSLIFGSRGTLYDRFDIPLAWSIPPETALQNYEEIEGPKSEKIKNQEGNALNDFFLREYTKKEGLAHVLGYISYPKKDKSGIYYDEEFIGMSGVEKILNERLNGKNGLKIQEVDATLSVHSESVIERPGLGEDVHLSIDLELNEQVHKSIRALAEEVHFQGGAGVIMDVQTGEIIALTNYPEYSVQAMVDGTDEELIREYISDKNTPFLSRAVSGSYTPGSIVKPFLAIGALEEGLISPSKRLLSTGALVIPNPYNPDNPSIFRDWKAHGWVNMREAIAYSSDEYFYKIGGGYETQKGLGIARIEKYMRLFGFGTTTHITLENESIGVLPNPEWKEKNFNGESWYLGNTYHTSIGQYGMQVTPVQVVRAVSSLVNGGFLVEPQLIRGQRGKKEKLNIAEENMQVAREGMREAVLKGTAVAVNISGMKVGAKTGTAELGYSKNLVNSWVIGFFPYESPRYAFAIVMEKGPRTNLRGAPLAMRNVLEWIRANRSSEYTLLNN